MKHQEYYRKYKTTYPPSIHGWNIVWAIAVAALVEPLLVLSKVKRMDFSFHYYLEQLEYFMWFAIPAGLFLAHVYKKESMKRNKGYYWLGKFEVIGKQSSLLSDYLQLAPGRGHKLKVERSLFDKTKIGDFIVIRRDALGGLDEVRRVNNLLARVAKPKSNPVLE
jgi:hypothetical protein